MSVLLQTLMIRLKNQIKKLSYELSEDVIKILGYNSTSNVKLTHKRLYIGRCEYWERTCKKKELQIYTSAVFVSVTVYFIKKFFAY